MKLQDGICRAVNLRREEYDVYIGREGRGHDGYFGNPYRAGYWCPRCRQVHESGGSTLPCYREFFKERISSDSTFLERVLALRGKRLGCFCKPAPCHGDVIAEFVNRNFNLKG